MLDMCTLAVPFASCDLKRCKVSHLLHRLLMFHECWIARQQCASVYMPADSTEHMSNVT